MRLLTSVYSRLSSLKRCSNEPPHRAQFQRAFLIEVLIRILIELFIKTLSFPICVLTNEMPLKIRRVLECLAIDDQDHPGRMINCYGPIRRFSHYSHSDRFERVFEANTDCDLSTYLPTSELTVNSFFVHSTGN